MILKGTPRHKEGMVPYQQYLRYLHNKQPPMTEQEQFEAPYLDYLQAPLQVIVLFSHRKSHFLIILASDGQLRISNL